MAQPGRADEDARGPHRAAIPAGHRNPSRNRTFYRQRHPGQAGCAALHLPRRTVPRTAHERRCDPGSTAPHAANPVSDEAWRHYFRHLLQSGARRDLLTQCNDGWVNRAWENYRPADEIQRNLDIVWEAASSEQDLVEFVRIAMLKQRVAIAVKNIGEASSGREASILLDFGLPSEALRRIWDGERVHCSHNDFATFALHFARSTGSPLPEHIMRVGLGSDIGPGNHAQLRTWFRAKSYIADPISILDPKSRSIKQNTSAGVTSLDKARVRLLHKARAGQINALGRRPRIHSSTVRTDPCGNSGVQRYGSAIT